MQGNIDVLSLTQKLITFNTINPPGQEYDCAKYLGKILEDGGFKTSYHEFAKGRTSIIAKIDCVGVPSSRKIEKNTYESIPFRVLTADQHPDHDTIATFHKRHLCALAGLGAGEGRRAPQDAA